MSIRSNVSLEYILDYFKFEYSVNDKGIFVVTIKKIENDKIYLIGMVEKRLSYWHKVGSDDKEYRDLIDAIKAVIDSYIDCEREFLNTIKLSKYSKYSKKSEII